MAARTASAIWSGEGAGLRDTRGSMARILQHAGGFACRVAHDGPAGRVRRIARDARQFERLRVGERHVAVQPVDEHRMAGGDGIDQLARGQARGRPVFMVPVAPGNPASGRLFGGEFRDARRNSSSDRAVAQLHAGQILAAARRSGRARR